MGKLSAFVSVITMEIRGETPLVHVLLGSGEECLSILIFLSPFLFSSLFLSLSQQLEFKFT